MKAELVNPFIESIFEVFGTMLGAEATRGEVSLEREPTNPNELMAMIGISGDTKGTVGMSLPRETALKMVGQIAGMEFDNVDETVLDGVAEIVNMVGGGAKAKISESTGKIMDLGLPAVIRGRNVKISHPSAAVWLLVNFETDIGPFILRLTFDSSANGA